MEKRNHPNLLDQILEHNRKFVENKEKFDIPLYHPVSKIPSKQLAVFTCMDTRLVEFLEDALGIRRGDAKVIKNAGNTVTRPFGASIRSLMISIFELGVKEIIVIGHKDCGMAAATAQGLKEKMLNRGISPDAIKVIEDELEQWVDTFHHPIENVHEVVKKIRDNPFIPKDVPVHGLIFCPEDGRVELIVNGYEAMINDEAQ
ncbi:carbonic anhydrase [Microaerobacter geothermalis]|uniref:beta-class carbonic anhydrase n=1 Tax=Microaerobacter geothermalis TaxID=674972 RepID=UPI001F44C894|nr:carbonic anhydrase [Microaerobacter geothermalis]MCF6093726.1 carbonic anhydrase [Microaerobacter geothermalis]